MICPKCKCPIPSGLTVCRHCGASVQTEAKPSTAPKKAKNELGWIDKLLLWGTLAALLYVTLGLPDIPIAGKSLVWLLAYAGWRCFRDRQKERKK